MQCKFPYFEDRPHVPVAIEFGSKRARFLPLFDTGADYSLFSYSDALRLGLNLNDGVVLNFSNADGSEFKASKFELTFDIEGFIFKAPVCFAQDERFTMPVLGRRGVFAHFLITLCESEKYLEVQTH